MLMVASKLQLATSSPLREKEDLLGMVALAFMWALKTPTAPLHFWLPEAHVEATWGTSVLLACVFLKISLFGIALFMISHDFGLTLATNLVFVALSLGWATLLLVSGADVKRLGAFLSVLHMNGGLAIIMVFGAQASNAILLLWGVHTFSALVYFASIGFVYGRTGSRSVGVLGGLAANPIFVLV